MMKKIIAMLLMLVLCLGVLPGAATADAANLCPDCGAEGNAKDGLYYCNHKDEGTTIIYGTGTLSNTGWQTIVYSNVVIWDGVDGINRIAFRGCASLVSVTIPGSVETIDQNAFQGCSSLETVYYMGTTEPTINGSFDLQAPPKVIVPTDYAGSTFDGIEVQCANCKSGVAHGTQCASKTYTYTAQMYMRDVPGSFVPGTSWLKIDDTINVSTESTTEITLAVGNHTIKFGPPPEGYLQPEDAVLTVGEDGTLSWTSNMHIQRNNDVRRIMPILHTVVPQLFSINIDPGPGDVHGTVTASKESAYRDEVITLTVTPDPGYELESIYIGSVLGSVPVENNQFIMPDCGVSISASFKKTSNTYTVTIDRNITNGTVTAHKLTAAAGETIFLLPAAANGYELESLTVLDEDRNSIPVTDDQFTMPTSNVTVTATFRKVPVTYYLTKWLTNEPIENGSTITAGEKLDVRSTGEEPVYGLWYLDGEFRETHAYLSTNSSDAGKTVTCYVVTFDDFAEENTANALDVLTLKLAAPSYTVTVNDSENGTVTADKTTGVKQGETVTLTVTPASGYELESLTVKQDGTDVPVTDNTFVMPAGDVKVSATFKKPAPTSYSFKLQLKLKDKDNKEIGGDATGGIGNGIVENTVAITRVLQVGSNTLSFYQVPSDYISPEDAVLIVDADGNLTSGSDHVAVEKEGNVHYLVVSLASIPTYSITADITGNGTVLIMKGGLPITEARENTDVRVYIEPDNGSQLTSLLFNGTDVTNQATRNGPNYKYEFEMPAEDVTLTVTFATPTYTVTIDENITNGTVSADKTAGVKQGETVTLTVNPASGYELKDMNVTSEDSTFGENVTDTRAFAMPAGNVTVFATFKKPAPASYTYRLTMGLTDTDWNTVQGSSLLVIDSVTMVTTDSITECTLTVGDHTIIFGTPPEGYLQPEDAVLTVNEDGSLSWIGNMHIQRNNDVRKIMPILQKDTQEPETYTVTIDSTITDGTVTTDKAEAEAGDIVTLTVIPDDGYELDGYVRVTLANGASFIAVPVEGEEGKHSFTMVAHDATVHATFKKTAPAGYPLKLQLKLLDEDLKEIDSYVAGRIGDGVVENKETVERVLQVGSNTLTIPGSPGGYTVPATSVLNVDASGNLTSGSDHLAIEKDGDVYYLVMVLEKRLYNVTVLPSEHGTVTTNADKLYNGELCEIYISPDDGYELEKLVLLDDNYTIDWTGYVNNNQATFLVAYTDIAIQATFRKVDTYTITFNTDGGSPVAAITAPAGAPVTVSEEPVKDGYRFMGWDKAIPSVMPAENMTVTALWEKISVPETGDESSLLLWAGMMLAAGLGLVAFRRRRTN